MLGQAGAALPVARTLSVPVAHRPWKAPLLENSLSRYRDALKVQKLEGGIQIRVRLSACLCSEHTARLSVVGRHIFSSKMLLFRARAAKEVSASTGQVFSDKAFSLIQNAVGFSNTHSPINIKLFYPGVEE